MIKRIHGVHIPPKKRKPGRENALTIDFVLTGSVPAKKNLWTPAVNKRKALRIIDQAFLNKKATKAQLKKAMVDMIMDMEAYIRPSQKFLEWEEKASAILLDQAATWITRLREKGYELEYPISDASIKIYHYWKDNMVRDNSNRAETIHDLLVKIGVLTDDTWQNLTPNEADANCYEGEILDHITIFQVTAYNWGSKK